MTNQKENGGWIPEMTGVEQFVADYTKPLLPAPKEEEDQETDWQTRHKEREALRENIRNRVRNSEGSNVYFHKGMPLPTNSDDTDKRVGVYARVSTKSTEQTSSIENQQLYYTKKIGDNEHWEMQEIYSDEGKSGMEVKHRKEFQRMIADAGKGKMDMILCASVSRFARDISDCIKYLTKLRTMNPQHPVGVYFETENIYTLDPNSEQVLHFHALLAHWESANKSRRMILSYDQRICTGQYPVSDLLGYRHTKDGQLIIKEDEAKTVRYVFLSLAAGKSCEAIAADLTEMRRKTLKGRMDWDGGMVRSLTLNERRWGDLVARKTIVIDPREKIIVKNNGIRDWAFVPGHHEGIVTPELAKAAQYMTSSGGRLHAGVPDLNVIDRGALKGFVSICPRWKGLDRKTLLAVCESVYSDEELSALKQEIRIWTGQEESNVLSMDFTGYEVPRGILFLTRSMPSLTLSKKSLSFNHALWERLGKEEWAEMLYHPISQTIAVRASDANHPNAFRLVTPSGALAGSIESKAFSAAVFEAMRWIPEYRFRFRGITKERCGEKIILFSLDEPRIFVGKKPPMQEEINGPSRYIPYTTDSQTNLDESSGVAYPVEWARSYGLNCLIRKKRDEAMSAITEEDIRNPGVRMDNPLIGSIPDRESIRKELEELLLSM